MNSDIAKLIPTIQPVLRPFHSIPIKDCGEPLVALSEYGLFAFETPHPYIEAGAPYNGANPFMLRSSIAGKLLKAHVALQRAKPGWKLKIFDGYRPIAVQQHMIAHEFITLAKKAGLEPLTVAGEAKEHLLEKVYRVWSPVNHDYGTPPPHSTGAALDITLVDETGKDAEMGSPIDFNGPESDPGYFADKNPTAHANRELLNTLLTEQGFLRNPREWWHFSYGDQFWAWLQQQAGKPVNGAIYGRIEAR